jgi:hypothetical protein
MTQEVNEGQDRSMTPSMESIASALDAQLTSTIRELVSLRAEMIEMRKGYEAELQVLREATATDPTKVGAAPPAPPSAA